MSENTKDQSSVLLRLAHWHLGRRANRSGQRRNKALMAILAVGGAVVLGAGAAFAFWTLSASGTGNAQSATITNLTISTSMTAISGKLYPGAVGDVAMSIHNPNSFPVTITAVQLPTSATYAEGYTDSTLTTFQTGCRASTPDDVVWNYSSSTDSSAHNLTASLSVAAGDTLTVTMTGDALMTSGAPLACANTSFKMPALDGVTATSAAPGTTTSTATTDSWAS